MTPPDVVGIAEVSDAGAMPLVRELFREYAAAIAVDLETQDFGHELAGLPGRYAPPLGRILIARVDGEPAGCVALKPLADGLGEVKRLYVRPRHRGLGIGRRLVERLIAEARAIGYRGLRLDTLPDQMAEAVALYRSCGFVPVPAYWDNPLPGVGYMGLEL